MEIPSNILLVEFSALCWTDYGQCVYLCGNIPELGEWNPRKGLRLITDPYLYPKWESFLSIPVIYGETVELKLCILDQFGNIVRWESAANRKFVPTMSCYIEITQNDDHMEFYQRTVSRYTDRKKTIEILKDMDSDSSSSFQFRSNYKVQAGFEQALRSHIPLKFQYNDYPKNILYNDQCLSPLKMKHNHETMTGKPRNDLLQQI